MIPVLVSCFKPLDYKAFLPMVGTVHSFQLKLLPGFCLPGVGDFAVSEVSFLPDPCALPEQQKKRCLNEKEKLVYAPLSGVGGVLYDKDAVYVDLGGSHGSRTLVRGESLL
jgi:ribosome biogenesis protein BMS1